MLGVNWLEAYSFPPLGGGSLDFGNYINQARVQGSWNRESEWSSLAGAVTAPACMILLSGWRQGIGGPKDSSRHTTCG